jgi:hypothetical protein
LGKTSIFRRRQVTKEKRREDKGLNKSRGVQAQTPSDRQTESGPAAISNLLMIS